MEALTQSLAAKETELNAIMDRMMAAQEQMEEVREKLRRAHEEKVGRMYMYMCV